MRKVVPPLRFLEVEELVKPLTFKGDTSTADIIESGIYQLMGVDITYKGETLTAYGTLIVYNTGYYTSRFIMSNVGVFYKSVNSDGWRKFQGD